MTGRKEKIIYSMQNRKGNYKTLKIVRRNWSRKEKGLLNDEWNELDWMRRVRKRINRNL